MICKRKDALRSPHKNAERKLRHLTELHMFPKSSSPKGDLIQPAPDSTKGVFPFRVR